MSHNVNGCESTLVVGSRLRPLFKLGALGITTENARSSVRENSLNLTPSRLIIRRVLTDHSSDL